MFTKDAYTGPERRQIHRRTLADRRHDIRFEPSKVGRRADSGRRLSDSDIWADHEE